jgi:hypothetical protein
MSADIRIRLNLNGMETRDFNRLTASCDWPIELGVSEEDISDVIFTWICKENGVREMVKEVWPGNVEDYRYREAGEL